MSAPEARGTRTRNLYSPASKTPYRLSRSKIDLFVQCQRCFYLDRRLGVGQPPGFPFSLNSAVDALLKKEFDEYRSQGKPHPLMVEAGVDAIPFQHEKMDEWREALTAGVTYLDPETNLLITGGVDDVWVSPTGELHVVDYKATAKAGEVSITSEWQAGYRRQVEIYQWLFRRNGFKVSEVAYFVYCNGILASPRFEKTLHFKVSVLPHKGGDHWIPGIIKDIHACLNSDVMPAAAPTCAYCAYRRAARAVEG